MDHCPDCKQEIRFRMMNGRRVPFGCVCNRVPYGEIPRSESGHWRTTCPKCHARIFFLRHNGGCVWLDDLGYPWPEHGCFADEKNRSPFASLFPGVRIMDVGWIGAHDIVTDLGQQCLSVYTTRGVVELYVSKELWNSALTNLHHLFVGLGRNHRSIHLPGGGTFGCWPVRYYKCADCGKMYFQQNAQKESGGELYRANSLPYRLRITNMAGGGPAML